MNIDDFSLGSKLKSELLSVISSRKLPHAIIIEKGDFSSRIDFAYYLSACALCTGDDVIPCGICRNCVKAFGKYHPDISEFEREKDRKEFSVKIVRDLIKPSAYVKPGEADGKICIIKDADTMNLNAQNALLKILEEPPKNVKFILCCESSGSMLETIRSRSTVYSLLNEDDSADEDIVKARQLAGELIECLMLPTEFEFMSKTGVFEKDRHLMLSVLAQMQLIFRNAVFIKNNVLSETDDKTALKISSYFSLSNLLKLIDAVNELNDFANKNANLNLLLTRFSSLLRQAARG